MNNPVPVYIVKVHQDSLTHIVVGKNVNTLCDKKDVRQVQQVSSNKEPFDYDKKDNFCGDCIKNWEKIRFKIVREPTINCAICKNVFSGPLSRKVEDKNGSKPHICKACYMNLYHDDESPIETKYKNSKSDYDVMGDRTYTLSEKSN